MSKLIRKNSFNQTLTCLVAGFLFLLNFAVSAQTIVEYTIPTASSRPNAIITGPDGNLWFTEYQSNKIGKVTTAGVFTEYTIPTVSSYPGFITTGPDGNLWFTEFSGNKIGKVTTSGTFTEYAIPTTSSGSDGITTGPDGNLWFTENSSQKIGKVTTSGTFTEYTIPTISASPAEITTGPDGNLWFAEYGGSKIGKVTTSGILTEYTVPTTSSGSQFITTGSDANLWFTEQQGNKIGKVTTTGVFTEYTIPTASSAPVGITAGPDGNLWFAEYSSNKIGKVTTAGVFTEYSIPTVSSAPNGITVGPDGNLWFTENSGNKIGVLYLPHTVTSSIGTGSNTGSISPNGPNGVQTIAGGSTTTFTLTPTSPYTNITVNGTCGGTLSGNTFTTSAITANCTVVVNFDLPATIVEYTVPTSASQSLIITAGSDGNLWFSEYATNKIGKVGLSGSINEYIVPSALSNPSVITTGPDGNLWFAEYATNKIGKVTTSGVFTEYAVPTASSNPQGITAGPDGNLWFTELTGNKIGKVTTLGVFTEYTIPTASSVPQVITAGPDGNLWFAEFGASKIGKVTTSGVFTEYSIPTPSSAPVFITTGPDGNLWFGESNTNKIGKVTTSGAFTEYPIPTASSGPRGIITGPDSNLWFAEYGSNKISKLTTAGVFTEYVIPTVSSVPHGITIGSDGNIWFTEASANKIGKLILPYSENPSVGTGSNTGAISPNTAQVINGVSGANFTLTPTAPYTNINVTGTCGGTLNGNLFTTNPTPANHNCTVIANFYRTNTGPMITSGNSATFIAGAASQFAVMETGYPLPTLSEVGTLPPGMQFNATTGLISGIPNATGTYPIIFTATNGAGMARQNVTLTVLKTLQSLTVTSSVPNPAPNQLIPLTVTAVYSDGSTQDVTNLIGGITSSNMVSVIPYTSGSSSDRGKVYTRDPGTATLTVRLGSVTGTLVMNVAAATPYLQSIRLASPSTTLAVCQHANITATGIYSDGSTQDLTYSLIWKSTNTSAGIVNGTTAEVIGRAPGTFTVSGVMYARKVSLPFAVTVTQFYKRALKTGMQANSPSDTCLPESATVPIITNITPSAGPLLDAAHSPIVTIRGTDFMPDARVQLGTGSAIQCQPNNSATSCTYLDNETLQLRMPVMNVPGPLNITVTNPDNTASVPITEGANVYTVASLTGVKTFVEEQSSITESTSGPTLGGTGVALSGIFPTKGTPIEVDFDGVASEVATVDSTNRITVNTPAHAAGTVDVTLYEKNSDGTKTFLGSLPHAYQYRPQRCTLGNGTFGAIDQCVTELKACVYVPTAPTSTKQIEVTSHLVTNPTITGGMPQCVDAMPKFDLITVKTTDTYPKILCTTANALLVANRSSTPSAACASLASNAAGKVPNLTMIDLSYRDATGSSSLEEHALINPLTWEDRVSLIAASNETYKGTSSMQLSQSGYSPQTSSAGFCLLTSLPAHLPTPIANQNYCLNASLYTPPNEPLGSFPWTLQTIAEGGTFMVLDAGSQLV